MLTEKINKQAWLIILPIFVLFLYSVTLWGNYDIGYFLGFIVTWALVGGFGIELGHHRYFSHGHFTCSKWVARLLSLLGNLALNGSAVFWSAVHMGYHHRYADTEKDIHSPIHGAWVSYLGWTIYERCTKNIDPSFAGRRALGDKWVIAMHKFYYPIIFVVFSTVYLISPMFFFLSFIPAIFLSFNQGITVNVLCHDTRLGYTNFKVSDNSRNIKWLSYFTFGLALHNNHHKFPAKADFAVNPDEVDLGYQLVRLFRLEQSNFK